MIEKSVARQSVNFELLDSEIRKIEGLEVIGVSFNGQEVIAHLGDSATDQQIAQVVSIVGQHDATQLTERQQAEAARNARLKTLRTENTAMLDETQFDEATADVRQLAGKISWLELEILSLRGIVGE